MVIDDMVQIGNSCQLLAEFIEFLRETFTVTDGGEVTWFLGVNFSYDKQQGDIHVSQTAYLNWGLEKY